MWIQPEEGAALPIPTSQEIPAPPHHSQQYFPLFPSLFIMELMNSFPSKGTRARRAWGKIKTLGRVQKSPIWELPAWSLPACSFSVPNDRAAKEYGWIKGINWDFNELGHSAWDEFPTFRRLRGDGSWHGPAPSRRAERRKDGMG